MSADPSADDPGTPPPADLPGEPRWLDDDEQRTWRAWLFSAQLLRDRLDRDLTHDAGISHAYYEILASLSEAPDRSLRMSELAERCLSSRSRLSHAAARLEERAWIERRGCPDDGRGQVAALTDAGFGALHAAARVHVQSVRTHLFDQLSPAQQAALQDIGETLTAHLGGPPSG